MNLKSLDVFIYACENDYFQNMIMCFIYIKLKFLFFSFFFCTYIKVEYVIFVYEFFPCVNLTFIFHV